jgi:LysM repeat protein
MLISRNFEILDEEVSEDVEDENGEREIDCSYEKCQVTEIVTELEDVINVTDSQELSQENPDIFEIVWSQSQLSSASVRVMDDVTNITGNIETFIIYMPEDTEMPAQWLTLNVPFSENFDTPGTTPDMIPKEEVSISNLTITVKPNEDGVLRVIQQEVTLNVALEVYKESQVKILNDLFTPSCCLTPEKREIQNENLIMRNTTKNRVAGRIAASGGEGGILQVCNSSGNIKIDDIIKKENEVEIHGVVEASVMYVTSDDKNSLKAVTTNIPFKQIVEATSMNEEDSVEVWPRIEKMNANMISADEIDVRPNIVFDVSIFSKNKINVIDNVVSRPWSGEEIEKVPGIVGYIVKEGDTLMSIARKFFTTVKSITETNALDSTEVKKGDKLVVVKQPPVALKN